MLWFKKRKKEEVTANAPTLADELRNIADTSGFENLKERADIEYDKILNIIRGLSADGVHRFFSEDYSNPHWLRCIQNTNANKALYDMVCAKFRENGLEANCLTCGYCYLKIIITW